MTSVENESEIPELLEIPEQNLRLINEINPYFQKKGDLFVIIAREINFRYGKNSGDLRVGIIRIKEDKTFELVLPFSKNIIYANINNNVVKIAYVEDYCLKNKDIELNESGRLNFEDYAFLLDPEEQYLLSSRPASR